MSDHRSDVENIVSYHFLLAQKDASRPPPISSAMIWYNNLNGKFACANFLRIAQVSDHRSDVENIVSYHFLLAQKDASRPPPISSAMIWYNNLNGKFACANFLRIAQVSDHRSDVENIVS